MVKQVIVVRKDLKMRKGKLAAQVAHASMKVILDQMLNMPMSMCLSPTKKLVLTDDLDNWINGIFTKVCLAVNSDEELLKIKEIAEEANVINALITDVGKTVFNGVPTNTCLAIGPADSDIIDKITGHLKLL